MGSVLTQAAWTLFAVGAGAVAAGGGGWAVVAVAVVLGGLAAGSQSRWVQQRVPLLRTHKQRLALYYDSCYEIRRLFERQRRAKELEPWDVWRSRVLDWDGDFWAYMQRTRDDWRPRKRAILDPPGKEFGNWSDIVRQGLEQRLALIKELLAE